MQRRPEGLAEGECRYMDSRSTKKAAEVGAAMRAKQHRLPSKSNQLVFWPLVPFWREKLV